jgi:HEAT repeat protein
MQELPPEDQRDVFWVGPVGPIPIHYEDDPRFEEDRRAWSAARRRAQAMHTAGELLTGLFDRDERVRLEVVDRLIARAGDDLRTLPALLRAVRKDPAPMVRSSITMRLCDFDRANVMPDLLLLADDPDEDVRWAAEYAIAQLGSPRSQGHS